MAAAVTLPKLASRPSPNWSEHSPDVIPYLIVAHRPVGNPLHDPGIVRHFDLGRAGGGHTDPTQDSTVWNRFIKMVGNELQSGGFRKTWGRGTFRPI